MRKVIDSGAFRSSELAEFLSSSRHNRAVLIDYSALEPSKTNLPNILRENVRILSRFPRQVLVLRSTGRISNTPSHSPARLDQLVDWKHTRRFSKFCDTLLNTSDDFLRDRLSSMCNQNAQKHFERLKSDSKFVKDGIEKLSKCFSQKSAETLYHSDPSSSDLGLGFLGGVVATASIMRQRSCLEGYGGGQPELNSLSFRYALTCYLLAMKWISESGFQQAGASTITNDYTDAMYVAYATLFDGLITRDKKPRELHSKAREWVRFLRGCPHGLLESIEREWNRRSS